MTEIIDNKSPKPKALKLFEAVLLIICLSVLALRATYTESPYTSTINTGQLLGNNAFSLLLSATLLFTALAWLLAATLILAAWVFSRTSHKIRAEEQTTRLTDGPMFGTLLSMLQRPYIVPTVLFVLIFKLGDSAMGFMIKPFWVDSGFSAGQIGLVSVNIGLGFSIAGGVVGGWYADRVGIFRALWILGLWQAFSNLGYAYAASALPLADSGVLLSESDKWLMYAASAVESFTGGLGTAAFLAFLMAIVNKQHSATEYAILSSIFALSRSLAGWAGGFGADALGYADYFLLTFFLAFPAYLLLPWAKRMMAYAEQQQEFGQH